MGGGRQIPRLRKPTWLRLGVKGPAKLEDHLTVRTRIKTLRRASIVFEQNVYRGSELITEGEVRVGAVSRRTMAPAAMPESLYEKIRALLDLAD